jgi:hypothetical protein
VCVYAQIIADDVKCTHGCAVSDLSEEELFYFRYAVVLSAACIISFVLILTEVTDSAISQNVRLLMSSGQHCFKGCSAPGAQDV